MIKRNEGFTLVELLCAIVAGSIVTAATATILLLGLRMNANASRMATEDNKAVICLSVMEEMIKEKKVDVSNSSSTEIKIVNEANALFAYIDKKIKVPSTGAVLLEDVADCKFEINGNLLTIKLQLDEDEEPFVKTIRLVTGQTITLS